MGMEGMRKLGRYEREGEFCRDGVSHSQDLAHAPDTPHFSQHTWRAFMALEVGVHPAN
jgi:hypothetical protein